MRLTTIAAILVDNTWEARFADFTEFDEVISDTMATLEDMLKDAASISDIEFIVFKLIY